MSNNTYDIALTIGEAKEFHLLDEIKFKYFKDYCEDEIIYGTADYDISSDVLIGENEVNIKLELDWNEGIRTHEVEIYRRYSTSSPFAMKMLEWNNEEEEEVKKSNTKQELINLLGKSNVYHKYDDKAFGTSAEEFFKENGYKNLEFILYLEDETESILNNIHYYNCYGGSEAFHKIIKEGNLHFEWWDSCIGHLYLEEEEEE